MHPEQLPVDFNNEQLKQYAFLKPFVQRKQPKSAANRTHKTLRVTLMDENRSLKKQAAINARVIHLSSLQLCDEDSGVSCVCTCDKVQANVLQTSLRLRPYPVVVRLPNGRRSFVHACDVAPVDSVLTRLAQLSINQIVAVRALDARTCTMRLDEQKNTHERALVAQLDNDILQLYVDKRQASVVMAKVPTQVRARLHCGAAVDVVIEDERVCIPPNAKVHFDDSAMASLKAHLRKRYGVEMVGCFTQINARISPLSTSMLYSLLRTSRSNRKLPVNALHSIALRLHAYPDKAAFVQTCSEIAGHLLNLSISAISPA